METGKLMKALGYIAIIGIIVFFVMGLLSSISISLTLSHISSNFDIIIVLNLIILIGALCLFAHYFRNRNDKTKIEGVILIIAAVWLLFQLSIVGGLNYEYSKVVVSYSNTYQEFLTENPNDYLNASWHVTQKYYTGFGGTYNVIGAEIPSRNFGYVPYSDPIFEYYMNSMSGFQKLLVTQQKGNCGEFSQSISYLLNDSTHFPTRVINFEGIDHMTPEVEINNQWWVMDIDYLTSEKPINSYNFSSQIQEGVRDDIAYIYSSSHRENSLLKQHGFNDLTFP
jgi:hypothetical protein